MRTTRTRLTTLHRRHKTRTALRLRAAISAALGMTLKMLRAFRLMSIIIMTRTTEQLRLLTTLLIKLRSRTQWTLEITAAAWAAELLRIMTAFKPLFRSMLHHSRATMLHSTMLGAVLRCMEFLPTTLIGVVWPKTILLLVEAPTIMIFLRETAFIALRTWRYAIIVPEASIRMLMAAIRIMRRIHRTAIAFTLMLWLVVLMRIAIGLSLRTMEAIGAITIVTASIAILVRIR